MKLKEHLFTSLHLFYKYMVICIYKSSKAGALINSEGMGREETIAF